MLESSCLVVWCQALIQWDEDRTALFNPWLAKVQARRVISTIT